MDTGLTPQQAREQRAAIGRAVDARLESIDGVNRIPVKGAMVHAVSQFCSRPERKALMRMIDTCARPSTLFDEDYSSGFRTSYSGDLTPSDPFVQKIEQRICDLLGLHKAYGETMQGQRYTPGQQFKPHMDYFHEGQAYWEQVQREGGQRTWTAMIFLNEVEEGGATSFDSLGIKIPPQAGVLLTWNNMKDNGEPNPLTIHAGTEVTRGQKYVITKWFRERPWTPAR